MASTNSEKLEVLMKSKLTVRDITVLMDCGTKTASNLAKEFKEWFVEEYETPWLGIPTGLFVRRYNINENRIIKFAEIENKK